MAPPWVELRSRCYRHLGLAGCSSRRWCSGAKRRNIKVRSKASSSSSIVVVAAKDMSHRSAPRASSRDHLSPLLNPSSPVNSVDPFIRAKGPLAGTEDRVDAARRAAAGRAEHVRRRADEGGCTTVRSKHRRATSNSRTRAAIQEVIEARRAKSAQRVVRPSSAPSALTVAGAPKQRTAAGREWAVAARAASAGDDLSVCLARSVAKHGFRCASHDARPWSAGARGPASRDAHPMSARNNNNAPTWTSAKPEAAREDIDALPAGREYALSMCLASAVAKHTFRDKAATLGPQISPQRMAPRRDDDDGNSSSPARTSVASTAARDDDALLSAGNREYALSMCMASAVAKHTGTFRDHHATGPQISPARRGKGRVALMPLPVTRCDPLLQESIVKYEHEVRGAGGGKQISPCRHHPV